MFKQTRIAAAVSAVVLATASGVYAQEAAPKSPSLDAVTVTGIRASMDKSLEKKRAADGLVEVVSAEDVGKMPDKNLADSLQRLSTVAVRTDYDEAEKVSMRGTNPDMSLVLFNGHSVSGGDWYIADQQSSSRSTSLSLMPSSVLNQALVYRTSQANVVDGGLAGTINVTTRKPLEQRKNLGGVVSLGISYAALPDKSAPDLNASVNWKNDEGTLGAIVQVFSEKRFLRRDSVTRSGLNFGWTQIDAGMRGITDASLAGTGLTAADLQGVRMPSAMGTEFVEGVRDRKGGMLSLQWKPIAQLDMTLTSLQTDMNANNYGRQMGSGIEAMLRGNSYFPSASTPNPGTIPATRVYAYLRNPVIDISTSVWGPELKYLKSAEIVFPAGTNPMSVGNADNSYRDGASASSGFTDLDFKYKFSDSLVLKGLLSSTRGAGETKEDQGIGFTRFGTGMSYTLNGLKTAPDFQYIGAGAPLPVLNSDGSGFQANTQRNSASRTVDQENSIALNLEYEQSNGPWTKLEVGVRHADHRRNFQRWVYTRKRIAYDALPTSGVESFPSNFGSALGSGFDNTGFYYNQDTLQSWIDNQWKSFGPEWDRLMNSAIDMREQQSAAFVMQNFESGKLSGNVGLRAVRTLVNANVPTPIPANVCAKTEPGKTIVPCTKYPDAIVDAANLNNWYENTAFNPFGGSMWYLQPTQKTFWNVLPSANFRYELDQSMVVRMGLSKTIGRQNYNIWGGGAGTPICKDGICTVTGPNPDLKPMTAENFDLNWSWYFAPRSLLSVGIFQSNIEGYTKFGGIQQDATIDVIDPLDGAIKSAYLITAGQQGAQIRGFDIGFEQPIGNTGFGITSNISRAVTSVDDGRPMTGASQWAGNLGGYYENDKFSIRLVFNYRGDYVSSATAPGPNSNAQGNTTLQGVTLPSAHNWAAPVVNVALSSSYKINKNLEASFSATNLTNPVRAVYRYSEAEVERQDVSGRQYYFNLKYML